MIIKACVDIMIKKKLTLHFIHFAFELGIVA